MNARSATPPKGKRVLALVTDAYGGYGGIAAYSRDVLRSLCEDEGVAEVVTVPRVIRAPVGELPPKLVFDTAAARSAGAFVRSVLRHGLRGGKYDLIYCAHVNHAPLAWLLSKMTGTPWALCLYGMEAWVRTGRKAVDAVVGRADLYVVLSQVTVDRFLKVWPVAPDRCIVVHNAIHLEEFGEGPKNPELERRYGLEGKKVLMTFGRLDATEQAKGFDRVIELLPRLAQKVPNIAYLICGDGDDRGRLEAMAVERGVRDRVVFAGMIEEAEKADHYRTADVYVMPSKFEGFGFVNIEAIACGIPTIASTIDGSRESVREGEIGWMVDPFDPDAIEKAVMEALATPRGIPEGLSYFAFSNFRQRLQDTLRPLMQRRG
jgi:glycosyltransferase involved in cell wall biosynthesis